MAKIWEPQHIDVYRSWVNAILNEGSSSLNDWESNFVDNIDNQLATNRNLTQPQAEKLEQIYVKYTS